jgi:hypothetical protein
MPNYTYATLANAQDALSARLYQSTTDPTQQQWTPAELTVYLVEALRNWNALTSYWRAEFPMALQQGVTWYDITNTTTAPQTLRPFTVTDGYLAQAMEYQLLEPPTTAYPLVWAGSKQFAIQQILDAITRRQNEVLGRTGCTMTRQVVPAPIVRTGIVMPDSTIDIRRVVWSPVANQGYSATIMRQTDAWAKRTFDFGYLTRAETPPATWMQSTEPPPRFDVDNVPPVTGQYEVLTVNAGGVANVNAAQKLFVPDDWSWLVKWGALGDLLSGESNAKDSLRAAYCQKRYTEGLVMLSNASAVLEMQLNGLPQFVDAVSNGDNFNSGWQGLNQGYPMSAYQAGLNLIAFPPPDAGPYGALLTVVENAPVPVLQTDFIQAPRNVYDVILDMAQHLAMWKLGGAEFEATVPLYGKFLDAAKLYGSKLVVMGQFEVPEYAISQLDEARNQRVGEM